MAKGLSSELWLPKRKTVDVFKVVVEQIENLTLVLGASGARTAYNRGGTILIEWTMMYRETFSALVGQYIIRNERGELRVVDAEELHRDFEPYIEEEPLVNGGLDEEFGKLLAVHHVDGEINEALFELPNGKTLTLAAVKPMELEPPAKKEKVETPRPQRPHNQNRPSPADIHKAAQSSKDKS